MVRGMTEEGEQRINITCFFEELALPKLGFVGVTQR